MITISDVRARFDTTLDDPTIQRIIDAELEALERAHGNGTRTDIFFPDHWQFIHLTKPAATITSITERRSLTESAVTLATDDYRKITSYTLMRLDTGTNQYKYWGAEVVIVYTYAIDQAMRDRILLDLVQLSAEFRAYDEARHDEWSERSDYIRRRQALLSQIREPRRELL